jgi:CRP-like cAMP-binding protein
MGSVFLREYHGIISPERLCVQLDPSAFLADQDLLQALQKRATPLACNEDLVLFRQGDAPAGMYILVKGEATIAMNGEGGEPFMSIKAGAGSLLGLPGLIGNQPYSLTAIALRGSQVSFIARDDFNALMQSELPLLIKVLKVLAAEVRSARLAITQL